MGCPSEYNEASAVLADGITHLPFGPLASMTLGNGLTVNRSYDRNYRLTGIQTAEVQELTYNRDVVGNVTAVDDGMNAMVGLSMGYDDLDRLISASGSFGYPYGKRNLWKGKKGDNASGSSYENQEMRRRKKGPHNAFDTLWFDYDANGEMIDVVSDAAGNTIMYGDLDLTYNTAGRISQVEADGKILGSYVYSADGRRVKKVVNKKTVIFHYDLDGRLIAESDRQRGFAKLYIYLEGAPLAMVELKDAHLAGKKGNQVKGSAGKKGKAVKRKQALKDAYYYHTDHLGTPQRITDRHGKLVWAANYLPFGQAVVTLDKVENNLRFAGQYENVETGLHYNYWRYYDPALGRYLRVDPIGLEGGINPYVYVGNNPGNRIDPYGLYWKETNAGGWNQFEGPPEPRNAFWNNVLDDYTCKNNSGNFISEEEIRSQISLGEIPMGPGRGLRGLLGKGFPTKLNRGGLPQPYDPKTGRYLSYGANPGLKMSPAVRFAAGFGQGWAAAKGASGGTTPIGTAGNIGYTIGSFLGNLF